MIVLGVWCWWRSTPANLVPNLAAQTVTFNFADNGSSKSVLQHTAMQKQQELTLVRVACMAFGLKVWHLFSLTMPHPAWLLYHTTIGMIHQLPWWPWKPWCCFVILPTLTKVVETYVLFGNCADLSAGDTLTLTPAHLVSSPLKTSHSSFLL